MIALPSLVNEVDFKTALRVFVMNFVINCKKEDIWAFFDVFERLLFCLAKEGHVLHKEDVCHPYQKLLIAEPFL